MFNVKDPSRNQYMLTGSFARKGYDWWWHNFTGVNRRTGREKAFFIEFYLCNPAKAGQTGDLSMPILGQLPANQAKGIVPSYLMVKAGCWGKEPMQLHRFFAWQDVRVNKGVPYSVSTADCLASDTSLCGSISISEEEAAAHPEWMCDAGSMQWELTIDKQKAFNVGYGAGSLFRFLKAFEMYWHAEGMKSTYSGTVTVNGEIYDILPERSYGYADKNWGRNFTSPWVWLSSSCLKSRLTGKQLTNTVFDIGGGCPKVYFLPLKRKLLGALIYEGEEFEYNFSKPWTLPRTLFGFAEDEEYVYWKVFQENYHSVIKLTAHCKKSDMVLVNYESPDGKKRHKRLFNGGNGVGRIRLYRKVGDGCLQLVDDMDFTHLGCEYGEYM